MDHSPHKALADYNAGYDGAGPQDLTQALSRLLLGASADGDDYGGGSPRTPSLNDQTVDEALAFVSSARPRLIGRRPAREPSGRQVSKLSKGGLSADDAPKADELGVLGRVGSATHELPALRVMMDLKYRVALHDRPTSEHRGVAGSAELPVRLGDVVMMAHRPTLLVGCRPRRRGPAAAMFSIG